ncbi:MAG TPA: tail fiber domain-containing protein [Methanosarcinales archaeon]|nr:tail fiber domain-containing protein [Methanosarcinales archaeon]
MAGNSWGGTTIGTNYRGTRAAAPPNWSFEERNPNQYDSHNYVLGDLWLNKITEQVWVLVSLAGNSTSKGELAEWIEWGGGGDLDSLTGDIGGVVFGDANRNINTLGTAGEVLVTGNPGINTLTWSLDGSVAKEFPTDAGTAIPAAGVLNVFGGTAGRDINTTGAGNTIHVELNNAIILGDLAPINSSNPAINIVSGSINFSGAALIQRVTWPAGRTRMMADGGATYFMDASANTQSTLLGYGNAGGTNVSNGNSSFGYYALSVLTVGATSNTAVGSQAGRLLQTGSQNTIVGANSFASSVAGTGNSVLGRNTLPSLLTGVGNIALGRDTGTAYTGTESYNILFSNIGVLGESNTCRIASGTGAGANQLNKVFFSGIRGITTDVNDAIPVLIDSAGQLGTISSSIRYKENVEDMNDASSPVMSLRPVVFDYKESGAHSYGLIAEEVAEVFPDLVAHNAEGEIETVKYHLMTTMLLNEIQKLAKRIEVLENR